MHVYAYIYIYVFMYSNYTTNTNTSNSRSEATPGVPGVCGPAFSVKALIKRENTQDSSKGGAVETGCSDVYDVIH